MYKKATLSEKIDPDSVFLDRQKISGDLQPRKETLKKILQFAAAYKAEKISEGQFVDIYLN